MQERPQYNITPEQGWSQMQTLLDKSMPVAYRSRRFLIYFVTTSAAVITLLATLFLWKEKANTTSPQPAITTPTGIASNETRLSHDDLTAPAAEIKVNNESNANEMPASDQATNNAVSEKNIKPTSTTKESSTIAKNPGLRPAIQKSSYVTQEPSNNNVTVTENIASAKTINLPNPDQQETPIVNNEIDISKTEINVMDENETSSDFLSGIVEVGSIRVNYPSLDFLPPVEVAYEISGNNIDLIQSGNLSYSSKGHSFRPDFSIGAMTGSQHGLGVNGGAGMDYALNSKLSLTASVGLSSYSPGALDPKKDESVYADPIIRTDANFAETYLLGEKVNSAADYEAINPFVKSIRQWEVSAGMKYTLAKRFFVEGGVTMGLGTIAKSEYPIVTFLGSATPTADTNVETVFNSYDIVRSNMTSVYGALGYHVSRHLSISLEWKHGLNHYLLNAQSSSLVVDPLVASEKRSDYIRGLNLGLSYTL